MHETLTLLATCTKHFVCIKRLRDIKLQHCKYIDRVVTLVQSFLPLSCDNFMEGDTKEIARNKMYAVTDKQGNVLGSCIDIVKVEEFWAM